MHRMRLSVAKDVCALQSRRCGTNAWSRAALSPRGRIASCQNEGIPQEGTMSGSPLRPDISLKPHSLKSRKIGPAPLKKRRERFARLGRLQPFTKFVAL
jgi:hypothetical protein